MGFPALLVLAVLVAGQFGTIDTKSKEPGIVGPQAERTCAHEFPFFAILKYNGLPRCGGSLIRKDVVLTAAHCFYDNPPYLNLSIELGRYSRLKDPDNAVQYMTINKFELYPFFNIYKLKNDVALIFLKEKARINEYVQTIDSLAVFGQNEEIKESTRCYVTGYGITDYYGDLIRPEYPFKLNANIGKYAQCQKVIKEWNEAVSMNPRKEVCVFEDDGSSGCNGDSGGPLFCDLDSNGKYVQHGVVSWGPNCGNRVSMFARVSYFHRWIKYKIAAYRREKI